MKGTKLWTEAGSPLIQGRSRMQRPLSRDWLATALGAWMIAGPLAVVLFDGIGSGRGWQLAAGAGAASLVVSGPVVWFLRKLGTRNAWRGSALITAALAPLVLFLFSYVSVLVLGK